MVDEDSGIEEEDFRNRLVSVLRDQFGKVNVEVNDDPIVVYCRSNPVFVYIYGTMAVLSSCLMRDNGDREAIKPEDLETRIDQLIGLSYVQPSLYRSRGGELIPNYQFMLWGYNLGNPDFVGMVIDNLTRMAFESEREYRLMQLIGRFPPASDDAGSDVAGADEAGGSGDDGGQSPEALDETDDPQGE